MLPDWLRELGVVTFALVVVLVGSVLLVFGPPLLYLFVILPALPGWIKNTICAWSPCFLVSLVVFLTTPLLGFGAGVALLGRFQEVIPFPEWF